VEMDEDAPEIARVLFHPVVLGFDLLLVQEPQYPLFQLTGSLPRDDLHDRGFSPYRLFDDFTQRAVDVLSSVVDIVKIEFEFQ